MAAGTSDGSDFFKKMKQKGQQAHDAHKGDQVQYDTSGDLPPMEGTARLVECGVRKYEQGKKNAGKHYFYAAGIVVSPEKVVVDGQAVKVQGRRTSIIENLFDTPEATGRKSFDDHWAFALNELKKLGVDTDDLSFEDVEAAMADLKESQPVFAFRAWRGNKRSPNDPKYVEQYDGPNAPPPRVNHVWNGIVEVAEDGEEGGEVEDETAAEPAKPAAKPTTKPAPGKKPPVKEPEPEEETEGETEEETTEEEETGDDDTEAEEEETPAIPDVGEVWMYKSPKSAKAEEYEVTKVDNKKQLASLKQCSNPKVKFEGVPFAKLTPVD